MDIKFSATEFQEIARNYKGGDRIVKDETVRAMTRSVVAIEADAKRRVPTDTHNLQRSITHEVQSQGTSITGRSGTNQDYAEPVEKGRSAGSAPPPSDRLLGWLQRKGIPAEMAFVVARSIGRRGIHPRPYLIPAYTVNKAKIDRELGTVLMTRIMKRVGGNG